MNWTEIILTLAILTGLGFWMRGYYAPARRTLMRWRELIGQFRRLRQILMQGGTTSRNNPQGGFRNDPRAQPREKVVDVHASRGQERRAAPTREQAVPEQPKARNCYTCGDVLNEAQVRALQSKSVRCPGSNRVGKTCPFYGERTLN